MLKHVRVIQGDGINEDSIRSILAKATLHGFSATNIAFGMGGALLQQVNRDTQRFAFKCSAATVGGRDIEVYKKPATDALKASKRGRLDLTMNNGKFETVIGPAKNSVLQTVFENGEVLINENFYRIRERAQFNFQ